MNRERWQTFLAQLGVERDDAMLGRLQRAYGERHRAYHTATHIDHCLRELDRARALAMEPVEVECALWFHDAIYQPYRGLNEERSAAWAAQFLRQSGAAEERIERVREMILATRHAEPPASSDGALVVDIDLSILGAEPRAYEAFEKAVRREYQWVPWFLYRSRRAGILQSFLNRPRIYHHEDFAARYEAAARRNLAQAIGELSG